MDDYLRELMDDVWSDLAPTTQNNYRYWFGRFVEWCKKNDRKPVPCSGDAVVLWMRSLVDDNYAFSTIVLALAPIASIHKGAGYEDPTDENCVLRYKDLLEKKIGKAPEQHNPLTPEELQAMQFPDSERGIRDRALVYFGWAGGLRVEDLVPLEFKDILLTKKGCIVCTSSRRQGPVFIPKNLFNIDPQPLDCLSDWLQLMRGDSGRGTMTGPVFCGLDRWGNLSGQGISNREIQYAVKDAITRSGLNRDSYSSLSLAHGGLKRSLSRQMIEHELEAIIRHRPNVPRQHKSKAKVIASRLDIDIGGQSQAA